jgi:hypothetical protein
MMVTPPTSQSFQPDGTLKLTYYQVPPEEPNDIELSVMAPCLVPSHPESESAFEVVSLIELGQINCVVVG